MLYDRYLIVRHSNIYRINWNFKMTGYEHAFANYLSQQCILRAKRTITRADLLITNGTGISLQWRHNDHDSISNHQPHDCLLNRLFRHRSKKTSRLRVTGLCVRNSPGPVNSPHKGPVTRKMFPFDDVIMVFLALTVSDILLQKEFSTTSFYLIA